MSGTLKVNSFANYSSNIPGVRNLISQQLYSKPLKSRTAFEKHQIYILISTIISMLMILPVAFGIFRIVNALF